MTDIIDYTIVRKTYESYLKEITYCKNDKEFRLVVKRFLDFSKRYVFRSYRREIKDVYSTAH